MHRTGFSQNWRTQVFKTAGRITSIKVSSANSFLEKNQFVPCSRISIKQNLIGRISQNLQNCMTFVCIQTPFLSQTNGFIFLIDVLFDSLLVSKYQSPAFKLVNILESWTLWEKYPNVHLNPVFPHDPMYFSHQIFTWRFEIV